MHLVHLYALFLTQTKGAAPPGVHRPVLPMRLARCQCWPSGKCSCARRARASSKCLFRI
jgi:hypothetical protein